MKQLQQTGMVAVWILTIGMSFLAICYTMIIPFLPVYLLELGVEREELALWSGLSFPYLFCGGCHGSCMGSVSGQAWEKVNGRAGWTVNWYILSMGCFCTG